MASLPQSLNVIALISGGKDSIFSIIHCVSQGHNVIALANVYPESESKNEYNTEKSRSISHDSVVDPDNVVDDIDSFMYQTVGHTIIPLYSEALQLPLYRQPIQGAAVIPTSNYTPPSGELNALIPDETESLLPLLKRVMDAHPEANAVCTGAVLSTYQRTRIESIAVRLGLIPLSYLWQYPSLPPYHTSSSLLDAMLSVGLEARIAKVASGGLDESFLWTDVVGKGRTRLVKGLSRFNGPGGEDGGAVIGEGGEYETISVDGPTEIWKGGRIEARVGEIAHGDGGTALVRFAEAVVVPKDANDGKTITHLVLPRLFDTEFSEILFAHPPRPKTPPSLDSFPTPPSKRNPFPLANIQFFDDTAFISNICCPQEKLGNSSAANQMKYIVGYIETIMTSGPRFSELGGSPNSIVHTTLLLRQMSDFAAVNKEYAKLFTKPLPPSRVTIACGDRLPDGCDVIFSAVVGLDMVWSQINDPNVRDSNHVRSAPQIIARTGLHVQSRSYWAPANIGPYSQTISHRLQSKLKVRWVQRSGSQAVVYKSHGVDCPDELDIQGGSEDHTPQDLVWFAGQIPLEPKTMSIYQPIEKNNQCPSPYSLSDSYIGTSIFMHQAALALQHLFRIGRVVSARSLLYGVAYIPHTQSKEEAQKKAQETTRVWNDVYCTLWKYFMASIGGDSEPDDSDFDVWFDRCDTRTSLSQSCKRSPPSFPSFEHLQLQASDFGFLYSHSPKGIINQVIPPIYVVQVAQLPVSAPVEWTSLGISKNEGLLMTCLSIPAGDGTFNRINASFIPLSQMVTLSWTISMTKNPPAMSTSSILRTVQDAIHKLGIPSSTTTTTTTQGISVHGVQATVYSRYSVTVGDADSPHLTHVGIQTIPCEAVYDESSNHVSAVIIAQVSFGAGEYIDTGAYEALTGI